ncbi:MAG: hypothetical protein ACTHQ3_18695 [Motilibacteraceae bacterium]
MRLRKSLVSSIVGLAAAATLALTPATGFAAGGAGHGRGGGGGGGGGVGGGGGGGETTVANNLSVPGVFIGNTGTFALQNSTGELVAPKGDPSTGYELPGYYYVQGKNAWQAQYVVKTTDSASAKWGDNLTGSASKRVGHQIRVEMVLTSTTEATTLQGYSVVKLNASQADNVSPWGTLATSTSTGYTATAATLPARVWVAGATLAVISPTGSVTTVGMPGEINASGALTFGYNWKPTTAGTYTLEFHVPEGTVTFSNPAATTLNVAITSGGSGGGGGRGR